MSADTPISYDAVLQELQACEADFKQSLRPLIQQVFEALEKISTQIGDALRQDQLNIKVLDPLGDTIDDLQQTFLARLKEYRSVPREGRYGDLVDHYCAIIKHDIANVFGLFNSSFVRLNNAVRDNKMTPGITATWLHMNFRERYWPKYPFLTDAAGRDLLPALADQLDYCLTSVLMKLAPETDAKISSALIVPPELRHEQLPFEMVLLEILKELVENGVKAMGGKGGQLSLKVKQEGGLLLFEVIDTGSGIPPENLPRIFNEGFTTRPGGTGGLGLHLAKNFIEQLMHGTIECKSAVGQGTTFVVSIPVVS